MHEKCIILLLISTAYITNGSILLWSKRKFKISPLQKFDDQDFVNLLENLGSPETVVYKSSSLKLAPEYKEILEGYYTGYNSNGEINTENAIDISGNGDKLDLEKIRINSNKILDDNVLSVIVIPSDNKRYKRDAANKLNTTSNATSTESSTNIDKGPVLYKKKSVTDDYFGLMYSSKPLFLKMNNYSLLIQGKIPPHMITVDTVPRDSSSNRLSLSFPSEGSGKIAVRFIFHWLNGYWSLNDVTITDNNNVNYNLTSQQDVTAPVHFSYHCSGLTIFSDSNNTSELHLYDMQVQIDSIDGKFSDAYDCVNFTSGPIWSSLFVIALLGLGLMVSLIAISDIKTMDKFDNYKTKQLSITVTE